MELHAYTRSIADLLSVNKMYVVPRFQREYSWEKEHVAELWDDLVMSMTVKSNKLVNNEYFIGALVLIGEDSSFEMQIVDGQQRLTTITILLSALTQSFKDMGDSDSASGIYQQYIEGKDAKNKPYFKLTNETPKPFFQNAIQYKDKKPQTPSSEEERLMLDAYHEFMSRLKTETLKSNFPGYVNLKGSDKDKTLQILEALREQVLRYLKVIYITVREEDDAYTIFETLNARGMSLSAVDLIKNVIFKTLNSQHPDDYAKTQWKKIKNNLSSSSENINIDTFFRHFWISKYGYTSEGRIYKSFRKLLNKGALNCDEFLKELIDNSKLYVMIASPDQRNWRQQEEKQVYHVIDTLNLFKVTQVRPLLLALVRGYKARRIGLSQLKEILLNLERFHFVFTAICSSRASGIDGKYSKAARDFEACTTKAKVAKAAKDLTQFLKDKYPKEAVFTSNFSKLSYTKQQQKDKKIIQYYFKRLEESSMGSQELRVNAFTLEHIVPQSDKRSKLFVGVMGNLLPLDQKFNGDADSLKLQDKLVHYKKSKLSIVKDFVNQVGSKQRWEERDAKARTEAMAKAAYKVWAIQ